MSRTTDDDGTVELTSDELADVKSEWYEKGKTEARNTQHTVSESADKLTLTTKVKRGGGTRDEDRIKVKVKGDDPDAVVKKLEQTVANLQGTTDDLRGLRAGESDE